MRCGQLMCMRCRHRQAGAARAARHCSGLFARLHNLFCTRSPAKHSRASTLMYAGRHCPAAGGPPGRTHACQQRRHSPAVVSRCFWFVPHVHSSCAAATRPTTWQKRSRRSVLCSWLLLQFFFFHTLVHCTELHQASYHGADHDKAAMLLSNAQQIFRNFLVKVRGGGMHTQLFHHAAIRLRSSILSPCGTGAFGAQPLALLQPIQATQR